MRTDSAIKRLISFTKNRRRYKKIIDRTQISRDRQLKIELYNLFKNNYYLVK